MVQATSKPDNWAFLGTNNVTEPVEEPCVDPDFTGRKTGWLRKMKNDSARGKWLTDNNWRFFVVDFKDQIVFYANSEANADPSVRKNISAPIAFSEIVDVKLLDRTLKRGLTERFFQQSDDAACVGLCLVTTDREMRLLCRSMTDAKQWLSIFNSARNFKAAQGQREKETAPPPLETESTVLGSDESPPQLSDTDSDGSSGRMRSWEKNAQIESHAGHYHCVLGSESSTRASSSTPPWVQPTPEPGSKPEVFVEPNAEDAFAALDALVDDMYVPEPDAPKTDVATAIKEAKAKRAQKANGEASGYAQQPVVAKHVAPKEMSAEDRTANDMALLKRQQMLPRSRKSKADDASPVKVTRPLKRQTDSEQAPEAVHATVTEPVVSQSTVPGPSEGFLDRGSWDEEEPAKALKKHKKKTKALQKQDVDEDDPTAGLDALVDGVLEGKPVSLCVHEHVNGFQCMQCDFTVLRFENFEWAPEANYLFFRNYYGKPKKLPRMLKGSDGMSAYCCQCAFKSVSSREDLKTVADGTRWKCISA
eukprot:gnl/MRDRNA2_/MRDRNA2_117239_c0_seq1.p1 gnl/MRDRNA2_/MRDRNA2_117239_c0~~gnl/MRDRNA2_/MRDRNA2_117239_c0_seq1.p1  ORF type:complete len:566 (+),score=129.47 gnl/MRDRNA2_/MRDRNA2_117239_c0_seq1:97-1698(+)